MHFERKRERELKVPLPQQAWGCGNHDFAWMKDIFAHRREPRHYLSYWFAGTDYVFSSLLFLTSEKVSKYSFLLLDLVLKNKALGRMGS